MDQKRFVGRYRSRVINWNQVVGYEVSAETTFHSLRSLDADFISFFLQTALSDEVYFCVNARMTTLQTAYQQAPYFSIWKRSITDTKEVSILLRCTRNMCIVLHCAFLRCYCSLHTRHASSYAQLNQLVATAAWGARTKYIWTRVSDLALAKLRFRRSLVWWFLRRCCGPVFSAA